jgi:acyl-CoA thioesterase YciA
MVRLPPAICNRIATQTIAMPCHTNANGDIFGGWIVSQMDLGGAMIAQSISRGRVVTVAIDSMKFINPVAVGDVVTCKGSLLRLGKSSMKIKVDCWALRDAEEKKVTEGIFTFVSVNGAGKPQQIQLA